MNKKAAAVSNDNELPTSAEIAALKAKHGKLSLHERNGGYAIVRHPKPADIEMLVGKLRENAKTLPAGTKPRPYDAMRLAYGMLKVLETKGFLENADNEIFVYNEMESYVSVPQGKTTEL